MDAVRDPFEALDVLEPPGSPDKGPEQLKQQSNATYMQALTNLENNVHIAAQNPAGLNDPNASNQVMIAAGQAKTAAAEAVGSKVNNVYHTERELERFLQEPIINVEKLKPDAATDLNRAGQQLCAQALPLLQKFPFSPKGSQEVTLDEFNGVFAPTGGALWTLYDPKLKQLLVKQGNSYKPVTNANVTINPAFVTFFNRMATVTEAFYSSGVGAAEFRLFANRPTSNLQVSLF